MSCPVCRQVKGLSGELFCVQTGQWAVRGAVVCADRSRGCQVSCPLCRQVKGLSGELFCVQTGQGAVR